MGCNDFVEEVDSLLNAIKPCATQFMPLCSNPECLTVGYLMPTFFFVGSKRSNLSKNIVKLLKT
jgi:hypothetical protein